MGHVFADIELVNGYDVEFARRFLIGNEEIKKMHLTIMVDTGAAFLCINENMQEILQFPYDGTRKAAMADGRIIECRMVKGVDLRFDNRWTTCRAMVLPGDSEPLLGIIPLEDMDVLIDPFRQRLIVNPAHPDVAHVRVKRQTTFRPLSKGSPAVCGG